MSAENAPATLLIREKAALPAGLVFESESFLPGWRIARGVDLHGFGRQIEEADWRCFYLAGEKKTIVFGLQRSAALRRAVKQILAKREGYRCNCLVITSVNSKSFLGFSFLRVTANYGHVQRSLYPVAESEVDATKPLATTRTLMESEEPRPDREVHTVL